PLPPLPPVLSQCRYGKQWRVDDVSFQFLWPADTASQTKPVRRKRSASRERNARSCVLLVRGAHHSALLTGDIGQPEERHLIHRGLPEVAVVMAAHHGSKSSSSREFILRVGAVHALAQAGRFNRYGHPHRGVQKRWEQAGAIF